MTQEQRGFAKHIILEIWDAKNTNSAPTIKKALRDACRTGDLVLDKVYVHRFLPYGISGVALIAEAHITIHTWPEYSFAAVDIYSSKDGVDIARVAEVITGAFSPCHVNRIELFRGRQRPARRAVRIRRKPQGSRYSSTGRKRDAEEG
jgi:S-adenosylmethionine decarboxylase proenzyme